MKIWRVSIQAKDYRESRTYVIQAPTLHKAMDKALRVAKSNFIAGAKVVGVELLGELAA